MRKQTVLVLVVFAFAAIIFFVSDRGFFTGFFGVGTGKQEPHDAESPVLGTIEKDNNEIQSFNAALSFEVLKKSKIFAKLELNKKISDCPEAIDANVLVENTGSAPVEAVKIKTSPMLETRACNNCIMERLGVGETKTVSLKICKASDKNPVILVSSANAETIELKTGETK